VLLFVHYDQLFQSVKKSIMSLFLIASMSARKNVSLLQMDNDKRFRRLSS